MDRGASHFIDLVDIVALSQSRQSQSSNSNQRRIAVVSQTCINTSVIVVISVKNALIDPVTLTFQPQNHIISRISQGRSLYQVGTLWDLSFLSYYLFITPNGSTSTYAVK